MVENDGLNCLEDLVLEDISLLSVRVSYWRNGFTAKRLKLEFADAFFATAQEY